MKDTNTPQSMIPIKKPMKTRVSRVLLAVAAGAALAGFVNAGRAQTLNDSWTNTFDNSSGSQNSTTSWNYWYDIAGNSGLMSLDTNMNSTLLPAPTSGPGSGAVLYLSPWPGVPENSGKGGQSVIYGTFDGGGRYNTGTTIDGTKYDSLSFDLYVDPSSPLNQNSNVCRLTVGFFLNNYNTYTITNVTIRTNNIGQWIRYICPINKATAPGPGDNGTNAPFLPAGPLFNINCYGGENANLFTNTVPSKMWIDNIYLKKSFVATPPPTMSSQFSSPLPGLNLFSAPPSSDQYQRNSIKLVQRTGTGWLGQQGMTYAFTITNFPSGATYNGYQAHIFLTTGPGTASALDYNEPNVIFFDVHQNANGTAYGAFRYKANEPAANSNMFGAEFIGPLGTPNAGTLAVLGAGSVFGTWSLTFNNDTNVTILGPGGANTNFNMRPDAVSPFLEPINVVFGAQPNQPGNVGQEVILADATVTNGGASSLVAYDNFMADTSLSNIWTILTGEPNTVFLFPNDPGQKIVKWSLPDAGFYLQTSTNLGIKNGWTTREGPDIGGTTLVRSTVNAVRNTLVPSAMLGPNQNYFRLIQQAFTKLQILMPGETNAPGTVTGKIGTPDPQTVGAVFNVTVNAVDNNWTIVPSGDTVHFTSTDTSAFPPGDTAMVAGSATVSMQFNTAGTWTVTASDLTDATKASSTSSPTQAQ